MNILRHKSLAIHSRGVSKKRIYFSRIKLLMLLFLFTGMVYIIINDEFYLEKLDGNPISGFALMSNNQFTTYDDIKDKLLKMGTLKGFFGQDIKEIENQIATIPWVKGVVVRKVWPDRLSIWLTEYEPVAIWNDTDAVSKEGIVFKLPSEKLSRDGMPILSGPDYQSISVLETWTHIYNYLKNQNIVLKGLSIDERGSWKAILDNDVILVLGRGEWASKLDMFSTIYPQIEIPETKKLSYIDLRYGIGAAIGLIDIN